MNDSERNGEMNTRSMLAAFVMSASALSALGGNLLSNPGFENEAAGWGDFDRKAWRAAPGEGENGSTAMLYEVKEGHASMYPRYEKASTTIRFFKYGKNSDNMAGSEILSVTR